MLPSYPLFPHLPKSHIPKNKSTSGLRHRHASKLCPSNQTLLKYIRAALHRLIGSCEAAAAIQVPVDA